MALTRIVAGAEGELTLKVVDEATGQPTVARVELIRPELTVMRGGMSKRKSRSRVIAPLPARGTVSTGFGFVLDDSVLLRLSEGPYQFRVTRGPESRVVSGNFKIEKTSRDEHTVILPRILDMRGLGWTGGDCLTTLSDASLPKRMDAEDLHLSRVTGPLEDSVASADFSPRVIEGGVHCEGGLAFYQSDPSLNGDEEATDRPSQAVPDTEASASLPSDLKTLRRLAESKSTRVAIEDPFAWPLPVYLASGRIDGCFVLGDWLRLDRTIRTRKEGRSHPDSDPTDALTLGRDAERTYWQILEAGLRVAPLAGSGDDPDEHPVGYNRLYVAGPTASSQSPSADDRVAEGLAIVDGESWWRSAWAGRSFATNGPLIQPKLDGQLPGHVFKFDQAEVDRDGGLSLTPELTLTVRDPVDYLEVIHNGQVHHTAKLDEFARARGRISPIRIRKSGWALIRVVTLHEGHFRAAMSAPWYFEVDGQRRVSKRAVGFFKQWHGDYESTLVKRSPNLLTEYAGFIRSARSFWAALEASCNAP